MRIFYSAILGRYADPRNHQFRWYPQDAHLMALSGAFDYFCSMQVLLTHGYFISADAREQEIMKPYPPLGLLYLSAWLEQQAVPHEVFDTTFSTQEALWEKLISCKPDVVAMYVNLMTRKYIVQLITKIRADAALQNTTIIIGGPEVRNHAQAFIENGADFLVMGEGEISFHTLLMAIKHNGDLSNIAGIAYKNTLGEIIINPEREKIKDLDVLPFPNRKAIHLESYLQAWKERHGKNAISVSTMRGCPYSCKWCSRAVYGLSYRRRSPEHVVEELKYIQANYNPDTIWFVDDVFTISHKWLEAFTLLIEQSGLQLPYECITRADRMNTQVIELLKRSGCFRVWIGAESGSQRIIDAMDRRVDVKQVREMIIATRKAGIEAGTFIMLGYPGEEESDIVATAKHLISALPDQYTITTAYPIKGTELYTEIFPLITEAPEWGNSSDRDIRFKRKYSERYYPFAVRYVVNSVEYAKTGRSMHKLKALAARSAMWFTRTVS